MHCVFPASVYEELCLSSGLSEDSGGDCGKCQACLVYHGRCPLLKAGGSWGREVTSKVWRPEFDLQLHMERNKSGHGGVFVVPALQQPALKPGRKPSTLSHQASSSNVTMEIRLLFWAWSPFLACGLRARLGLFSLWATSGDELASENFTTQAYEWLFTVLQARRSKVSGLQSFCPFRGSGEKLLLFGSQVFLCL